MENSTNIHIINKALAYKLEYNNIDANAVHIADGTKFAIEVTNILGCHVFWTLTPFHIVDFYAYFESRLLKDIFSKLLNDKIADYYNKHEAMILWINDEAHDVIRDELFSHFYNADIEWDYVLKRLINCIGGAGFLSESIYYNIISGYFESVAEEYINIDIQDVRYFTSDGLGRTKVSFKSDTSITVVKDFFMDNQIYNELTRLATTEAFLSDVRVELKRLLWKTTNCT